MAVASRLGVSGMGETSFCRFAARYRRESGSWRLAATWTVSNVAYGIGTVTARLTVCCLRWFLAHRGTVHHQSRHAKSQRVPAVSLVVLELCPCAPRASPCCPLACPAALRRPAPTRLEPRQAVTANRGIGRASQPRQQNLQGEATRSQRGDK